MVLKFSEERILKTMDEDYRRMEESLKDTLIATLPVDEQREVIKETLKAQVAYSVLCRMGQRPPEGDKRFYFPYIFSFDTQKAFLAFGKQAAEHTKEILDGIKELEKESISQKKSVDITGKVQYNALKRKSTVEEAMKKSEEREEKVYGEGQEGNGNGNGKRIDIHTGGGFSSSEHRAFGEQHNASRQIRTDAEGISEGDERDNIRGYAGNTGTDSALSKHSGTGGGTQTASDQADGPGRGDKRGTESKGSDELDRQHEQHQSKSRGDRSSGDHLQLNMFSVLASEAEQKEIIEKGAEASFFNSENETEEKQSLTSQEFEYRLLGRLKRDCDYYLGAGGKNEKHLWAGTAEKQILKMRDLYENLAEKPEWFTEDELKHYEKEMLLDLEPTVTVLWSESSKLKDGQVMGLYQADKLFQELDKEAVPKEGYYKTKFRIDFLDGDQLESYEGRQDFGDGDGGLISHIEGFHTYYAQNLEDKEIHEHILQEFVPFLKQHALLSEMNETIGEALSSREALTPQHIRYYENLQNYILESRKKLNQDEYPLPQPPKLDEFKEESREEESLEIADTPNARDVFKIGDTVYLDDTAFEITEIGISNVQLRDPTLVYPVFRAESKKHFIQLLQSDERNQSILGRIEAERPYVITDPNLGHGKKSEKYKRNLDAIKLLKKLQEENRKATDEEKDILASYVGWGGISEAFEEQEKIAELKKYLSP